MAHMQNPGRLKVNNNQVVNLSDVLSADPDFAEDIKAFYTDSVYADHSDSERAQLVKDRVEEHNEILRSLCEKQ